MGKTASGRLDPLHPFRKQSSPQIREALGLFFIVSGCYEQALAFHLMRMIAFPKAPESTTIGIFSGMEVNVKLALIRKYAALNKTDPKEISKICDKIQKAFARRNEFAHSFYKPQDDPGSIEVQNLKMSASGLPPNAQRYTASQIEDYAAAIITSVESLDYALENMGYKGFPEDW